MPLNYPVAPGIILLCDYSTGFKPPEMVKLRPAVVISPRLPHRDHLCTVVPLSGTPSQFKIDYQCRIDLETPLPDPFPQAVWWVKADMLSTVSFDRLDLFRTKRDHTGRRKYLQPKVSPAIMEDIYRAVLFSLGLRDLKKLSV
jgi:mRNA interferase MazF